MNTISFSSMNMFGRCFNMARVFIDCHMFSVDWFRPVLRELMGKDTVTFIYSKSLKMSNELSKVRDAFKFLKILSEMNRVIIADYDEIIRHEGIVSSHGEYISCPDCDDYHIFAIVYVKPTRYIFSLDARMARCRDAINRSIDKRYCDFIIISDEKIYRAHRGNILR